MSETKVEQNNDVPYVTNDEVRKTVHDVLMEKWLEMTDNSQFDQRWRDFKMWKKIDTLQSMPQNIKSTIEVEKCQHYINAQERRHKRLKILDP